MNGHSHDEQLSAFYDGELSAVERAELERLLTERPDLRSDLAAMADLSQRLSDLADDGGDFDLLPGVMERIRAGSKDRTTSSSPISQFSANRNAPDSFRRRWMPSILAIASLGLLVAATLPLMMRSEEHLVVVAVENKMASDMAPAAAEPTAPVAKAIGAPAGILPSVEGGVAGADLAVTSDMAAKKEAGTPSDQDLAQLLRSISEKRWINPGEMIHHLVEAGGDAMLVEYQVVDVERSATNVEYLLKKKGILPIPTVQTPAKTDLPVVNPDNKQLFVLVIEADPAPLNEAFTALSNTVGIKEVVFTNIDSQSLNDELPEQGLAANSSAPAVNPVSEAPEGMGEKRKGALSASAADSKDLPVFPPAPAPLEKASDSPQVVMGNSVALSNGTEVYPVLEKAVNNAMFRQNATQRMGNSLNSPGVNLRGNPPQPRSRSGVRDLEKPGNNTDNGFSRNVDLQYSNRSMNRARQLAIVVLKTESGPATETDNKAP